VRCGLACAHEAADIYRALAAAQPAAYRQELAGALDTLRTRLWEQGDAASRAEALARAREIVETFRTLAAAPPAVHRPNLAASLNDLAARLWEQADIARKCVRFCPSTCWTSTSRRKASLTSSVACALLFAGSPYRHWRAMRRSSSWTRGIDAFRAVSSPAARLRGERSRRGVCSNSRILAGLCGVSVSAVLFRLLPAEPPAREGAEKDDDRENDDEHDSRTHHRD